MSNDRPSTLSVLNTLMIVFLAFGFIAVGLLAGDIDRQQNVNIEQNRKHIEGVENNVMWKESSHEQ